MRGLTIQEYAHLCSVGDGTLATASEFSGDGEEALVEGMVACRRVDVHEVADADGNIWAHYVNSSLGNLAVRLWPATRHTARKDD